MYNHLIELGVEDRKSSHDKLNPEPITSPLKKKSKITFGSQVVDVEEDT
jgi:hypothetical protein